MYPDPFVQLSGAIDAALQAAVWPGLLFVGLVVAVLAFTTARSRPPSPGNGDAEGDRSDLDIGDAGERSGPVVCGVTEADPTFAAVKAAGRLARRLRQELILVHGAADPQTFPYGDRWTREVQRRQATINAGPLLRRAAQALPRGSAAEQLVVFGPPDKALARLAHDRSAVLVVVGRRSRGGPLAALVRSTAARLRAILDCPVISVPRGYQPPGTDHIDLERRTVEAAAISTAPSPLARAA